MQEELLSGGSRASVGTGHKANFCNAPRYKDVHNETLQTRQDVENKAKAGASRSMWDEPDSDDDKAKAGASRSMWDETDSDDDDDIGLD
uniref:Uncharacterized protein n=1 Tax=Meloidogyne floridensis TaxID=298350 RepID=A0A915PAV4_9BILA